MSSTGTPSKVGVAASARPMPSLPPPRARNLARALPLAFGFALASALGAGAPPDSLHRRLP
eukprot:7109037-Alexandrium_andersonii.AAC.1